MPLSEEQKEKAQGGKSLLQILWEELDVVTRDIIEHAKKDAEYSLDHPIEHLKGQAVGLAKAIIIFHRPFFMDIPSVSKEALVRYKNFKAGETYQTIGIAERIYEFPPSIRKGADPVAKTDPVLSEIQKIPDQHKSIIRASDKDADVMAKLFGCSRIAIERIRQGG